MKSWLLWKKWLMVRKWEALQMWIAWHLPRSIAKWAYIRVGAHATTGQYSNTVVPEITMMDALQRWDSRV